VVPHCGVQGVAQATCQHGIMDWAIGPCYQVRDSGWVFLRWRLVKTIRPLPLGLCVLSQGTYVSAKKIKDNHKTCGSMHFILEIQGNLILTKKKDILLYEHQL